MSTRLLSINLAAALLATATLARGQASGPVDPAFTATLGTSGTLRAVSVQADGRVLVGGSFDNAAGTGTEHVTRLTSLGQRDNTFFAGTVTGGGATVNALALQTDGRIVVGGNFTTYNNTTRNHLVRLTSNGTVDSAVFPGLTGAVTAVALQRDGKILAGHTTDARITRFNADGTRDTTFVPGFGLSGGDAPTVYAVLEQPDGKILVGGSFTTAGVAPRVNLARLNADGSVDTSFVPGNGTNGTVRALALTPEGKVLVGGEFSVFGPAFRGGVARVNADGSLDTGYSAGVGAANAAAVRGFVHALILQSDGRVLVAGDFTTYDSAARVRVARLTNTGTVDLTFDPVAGADGVVNALAQAPDGKVYVAGAFQSVNSLARPLIARLTNVVRSGPTVTGLEFLAGGTFRVSGTAAANTALTVLASSTLEPYFTAVGTVTTDASGAFAFTDSAAVEFAQRFYRVVYP